MKEKIKSIVPAWILFEIKNVIQSIELNYLYKNDKKRFKTYSANSKGNLSIGNVRSQVMYFSHQIEKGLSRKNFRYGFGLSAINNLVDALQRMQHFPNYENDDFYKTGISSLRAYSDRHRAKNEIIPNFENIPDKLLHEIEHSTTENAGIVEITSRSKIDNSMINFKELAMRRTSIRDFKTDEHVDLDDLEEAIEICLKTPSVCNRQSSRVKIVTDKAKIERILTLQRGFNGYELPDKLLLVTSDLSYFLRAQERNQGFIDGGLFSMSLLYSLEYKSIGACPLSANIGQTKVDEIRKILSIPESEILIMFIACGIIDDKITSPKSYRSPVNQITKVF